VTTGAQVASTANSDDVTIAIIGLIIGSLGLIAAVWAIITLRRTRAAGPSEHPGPTPAA
jgi:hypothetical protein